VIVVEMVEVIEVVESIKLIVPDEPAIIETAKPIISIEAWVAKASEARW
jgi:hypothetical protein